MNGKKAKLIRKIARQMEPAVDALVPPKFQEINQATGLSIAEAARRKVYRKVKNNFRKIHANIESSALKKLANSGKLGLLNFKK